MTFHAGARALADARQQEAVLGDLARDFSCGLLDVGQAVAKLRGELKARTDALATARGELVTLVADALLAAHPPAAGGETRIVALREKDDVGTLRALAGRIAGRADVVAFCASREAGPEGDWSVVVQRGAGSARSTAALGSRRRWRSTEGAGGGRAERGAEGRLGGKAFG